MRLFGLLLLGSAAITSGGFCQATPDTRHTSKPNHVRVSESLEINQFSDGKVLMDFRFTRSRPMTDSSQFGLFPKTLGEIVAAFDVSELHLTFTQGKWRATQWGNRKMAAAAGVQMWAWLNTTDVDDKWKRLTNALAGQFCASLNFINQEVTAEPHDSFRPEGDYVFPKQDLSINGTHGFQLRYGALPREITCTENLTPWTKLLPCQSKSGIASLFNAYKLFDTEFYSMALHIQPKCDDAKCSSQSLEIVQTLSAVFDPIRLGAARNIDWTLSFLLEREIVGACPLAKSSTVHLSIHPNKNFTWNVLPDEDRINPITGRYEAIYYLQKWKPLDIGVKYSNPHPIHTIDRNDALVTFHRYLTGYGFEKGGIAVNIYNYDQVQTKTVTHLETIPWFLKVYLHTLQIKYSNIENSSNHMIQHNLQPKILRYQPAIDRVRPTVIEMTIVLPPHSLTVIHFDFDRAFIKYTEHPPDANRGFDIGPSVLTVSSTTPPTRLFSETLLIALPTPDFSMPYNVITMTCTILALYFGSMFNLIVRRFEPATVTVAGKSALGRRLEKFKMALRRLTGRS